MLKDHVLPRQDQGSWIDRYGIRYLARILGEAGVAVAALVAEIRPDYRSPWNLAVTASPWAGRFSASANATIAVATSRSASRL